MLKSFRGPAAAFLAVATASLLVTPADAQGYRRRGGDGAGVAAGVIGGLAAGALVGGALAGGGGYAPGYAEDGFEGGDYGPGRYGACPPVREPVYDGAGRFAGYRAVPSC